MHHENNVDVDLFSICLGSYKKISWILCILNSKNSRVIYAVKFVFSLKSRLLFHIFYCLYMFENKHFIYLGCVYLKSKRRYNAKPLAFYFYVKAKILISVEIVISELMYHWELILLILIWMGLLGVRFEVGGCKITPCLKLVRIMLETWNLGRKCTHICSFRKYTF